MSTKTSRVLLTSLVALSLVACGNGGGSGSGDEFPQDDITLVIPYAAGGITDVTGRAYADFMSQDLGQTVVPENREGASGALAMSYLANADPDGYTLSMVTLGTTVLVPLTADVQYTKDDFTPIGGMTIAPFVLLVPGESELDSIEDFVAQAEREPGSLRVGTVGSSAPQAIELRRWAEEYGVEVTIVPMDGDSELATALLGNQIDATYGTASDNMMDNIEAGNFKPLMFSGPDTFIDGVPSTADAGFPELNQYSVFALAGPEGLPDDVRATIEESLKAAQADAGVREIIGDMYFTEEFQDHAEIQELIDLTHETYSPIFQ